MREEWQSSALEEGATEQPLEGRDYLAILFRQRRVLFSVIAFFLLLAIIVRFVMPREYEGTVVMVPATAGEPSQLSQTIGALASLGLAQGSEVSDRKAVGLTTLQSRFFLQQFVVSHNLMPVLFPDAWNPQTKTWKTSNPPTLEDAYSKLIGQMTVVPDNTSNVIRVRFRWRDPATAARIVNQLIKQLNLTFQQKAVGDSARMIAYLYDSYQQATVAEIRTNIANLIQDQIKQQIIAKSRAEYAFSVIDPAEPSKKAVSPGLLILSIAAVFLGLLIGIPLSFVWQKLQDRGIEPFSGIRNLFMGFASDKLRWRTS